MFNQEMPSDYVPRKYMVRGILDAYMVGTYYEIVTPNQAHIVDWHKDYATAVKMCDALNKNQNFELDLHT